MSKNKTQEHFVFFNAHSPESLKAGDPQAV